MTYYPHGRITLPIGNLKFSGSAVEYGQGGAATTQLSFDIFDPAGEYVDRPTTDEQYIIVSEEHGAFSPSKKFYVSSRSAADGITHITACDAVSVANKRFDSSGLYFRDGKISANNVLNAIAAQCGFEHIGTAETGDMYFTPAMLEEKSIHAILDGIANAVRGVWYADSSGGLSLYLWGTAASELHSAEKHTIIDRRGYKEITTVIVTDSETDEDKRYSTGNRGGAITVDTPFAAAAGRIIDRLGETSHLAWYCEKALLDTSGGPADISAVSSIMFGTEEKYLIGEFTVSVDASGVYFSGGASHQDDLAWQYQFRSDRELEQRLKYGKTVGNTQISRDGIVFVNKNKNTTWTEQKTLKKFGFDVEDEGTTEYDGAMIDGKEPEYVEQVSDNVIIVAYGDVRYRCTRTKNGSRWTFRTEKLAAEGGGS